MRPLAADGVAVRRSSLLLKEGRGAGVDGWMGGNLASPARCSTSCRRLRPNFATSCGGAWAALIREAFASACSTFHTQLYRSSVFSVSPCRHCLSFLELHFDLPPSPPQLHSCPCCLGGVSMAMGQPSSRYLLRRRRGGQANALRSLRFVCFSLVRVRVHVAVLLCFSSRQRQKNP